MSSMLLAMQDDDHDNLMGPPSMLSNPSAQQAAGQEKSLATRKLLPTKNVARKGVSTSRASAWKAKHGYPAAEFTLPDISKLPTSLPTTNGHLLHRPLNQKDVDQGREPEVVQRQIYTTNLDQTSVSPSRPFQQHKHAQASSEPLRNHETEHTLALNGRQVGSFVQVSPAREPAVKMGGSSKRRRSDESSPDEPHEDSNLGYSSSGKTLQGLNAPPLHRQNPLNSEAISARPETRKAAQPNNLTETDPPLHHSAWLAAWRERQKQESPRQVLPTKSRKKQTPLPYKPPTSTKTFIDLTLSDDDDDMEASASSKPSSEMSFVQLPNEEPIMSSKTSSATPCSTTGHDVDMLRQGQMTNAQKGVSYNERHSIDLGQKNGLGARQTAASSPIPFDSNNTPRGDFVRPQAVLQTQITRSDHSHIPPVLCDIDMTTRPAVSKKARRSALRFNTFLRKPEYTLDEAIYGLANGPNRPASSSFDQPTFNKQIYQKPLEPNPDTRCAHFDPRIHWTWERSPEWYEKKMAEVSTRGNKKSPSRFGQGKASLRRRLEKQKQAPRQEFPDRVLQNPQWLAAAQALKQMAALASKKKAISPILLDEMEFVFVRGQHHSYE